MLCAYFIIILKYLLKYIIVNKNYHFICRRNIDQIKLTSKGFFRTFYNFTYFYLILPKSPIESMKNVLGIVSSNFPT